MTSKVARKLYELRQISNEEIDKERFDRDPAYRAKVVADLERLVELEVQVTLEGAKGSA